MACFQRVTREQKMLSRFQMRKPMMNVKAPDVNSRVTICLSCAGTRSAVGGFLSR